MRTLTEMEDAFYKEARAELLAGLAGRPESQQLLFKRMYAHKHLDWSIKKTVANMSRDKLDWAMQQVQRAIDAEEQ